MKRLKMFIIIGLFFMGLSGCASTGSLNSVMSADSHEKPLLTAQDHLNHAQMLEQDLGRLEEQVARIDRKVARYEQKPYLDPKGFRRDALKILRGSNVNKIETLQEQVAWHWAQASRLTDLDSSPHDQTLKGGSIVSTQGPSSDSRATNDMTTTSS